MGVLACDRKGCENIMCDFLSHEHGYLCWECKDELIARGPCNVHAFMETPRREYKMSIDWQGDVDKEFKARYED
jgi:hypothetical protein